MPRATAEGVAADHARIAARRRRALVSTALRTRSVHAREVLAEVAWAGHTPAQLESWVRDQPAGVLPPGSDPAGVADYARVVAVQLGAPEDRATARLMLESVAAGDGWGSALREHVEMLASLRVLDGDTAGALALAGDARVRPDVADALRADALHPALGGRGSDLGAWARAFSTALHGGELAPFLAPARGELPSLDDLATESRPPVTRPERVTVVMSCYRPDETLLTAVRSVLAQTWTNLELLVVDDASGPGPGGAHDHLLERVEAADPRVHVIRKAVNGGTYRARNTALRRATGDLAVVIDSDDWWHPQALEVLAAPLLADPSLMATRAQGVRVRPDLVLTRPGYRPRFVSAATVLFRLRQVVSRIGFYDPTRKSADTEHTRRMVAAFGSRVLRDVPLVTTVLRGGDATLSSDEFGNGWRHPARHQYKSLYTPWHEEISAGAAEPYLDPELPRRFPEPLRWGRATHPLVESPRHLDLCLAGDWRRHGGPQRSMFEEIRAAREAGLRVGVMHLEALRFMSNKDTPVSPHLVALLTAGDVEWVHPDDDVDIDVLMVRYPPILQYPPYLSRRVRARQVLVMANQGPVEADGTDQRYVVSEVTQRTRELFDAPVLWVPQSPTIRRLLLGQDPTVPLTGWDNPGLIDLDEWSVRPDRLPGRDGRPVVVGRHSRDDRIKFPPSYDELVRGYTFPSGYEVRMLGAEQTVEALRRAHGAEPLPDRWRVLPHGSVEVRDFLAELDFYLYLDNPDAHEAFGRTLLEAAASRVLTIAHPKHEPTFGDALDYALPGQAQELIARYVADPAAYTDRVARTRAAVAERFGHAGFVSRLRDHLRPAPPEDEAPVPAETVTVRPGRVPVDTSDGPGPRAQGALVEQIPVRSAADAERADGITVVHAGVGAETLRAWLHPATVGIGAPDWTPLALVGPEPPPGVLAVLCWRDGLVWAAGRGMWTGAARDPELSRLALAAPATSSAPADLPSGWDGLAWWQTEPPARVTLRPGESLRCDEDVIGTGVTEAAGPPQPERKGES